MNKSIFLAGVATVFLALPATANAACSLKDATFKPTGDPSKLYAAEDCNETKNLNGRVGEAASLAAAADTRIGKTGERLNLDLNAVTHDFGGSSVGGGMFVHVPELADGLYLGARGAYNTQGGGGLVGVGVTYSFSPF